MFANIAASPVNIDASPVNKDAFVDSHDQKLILTGTCTYNTYLCKSKG
jgi:hypothetical protein